MIRTKSIFDPTIPSDGTRILITIRPLPFSTIKYDEFLPALAPSRQLLADYKGWNGKQSISWVQYEKRFREEMAHSIAAQNCLKALWKRSRSGEVITLLCWEKETNPHCHRHIVKQLIDINSQ